MVKEQNPKLGVTLGIVLGLVLAGGLAATPFYLPMFQPSDLALRSAVSHDVQELTRIVGSLDAELSAINDIRSTFGAPEDPTDKTIYDWQDNDNQYKQFLTETVPTLEPTSTLFRQIQAEDEKRGTANLTLKIMVGKPNGPNSKNDMANKYSVKHEALMRQAKQNLLRLSSLTVGDASANSDLDVTRARAMLQCSYGRILRNRAEFEYGQAVDLQDEVSDRMATAETLRAKRDTLLAAGETASAAALSSTLSALEQQAKVLDGAIGQVQARVEEIESRLAEIEPQSTEIEGKLNEAIATNSDEATLLRLAADARKLTAESAMLRNGALVGARRIDAPPDKPGLPTYEGGTPQPGLRDLQLQLAQVKDLRAGIGKQIEGIKAAGQKIEESAKQLQEEAKKIESKSDKLAAAAKKLSAGVPKHLDAARAAEADALKAFEDASRAVRSAITAAARRTRDAATAASEGGATPDERLQRITGDNDTEASLHCLSAEIAYYTALTHVTRIVAQDSLGSASDSKGADAKDARKAALAAADDALKAYEQASRLISRTNVRLASGSVSGKNYLWEVQIGEAGVHLLQAYLQGPRPGADKEARKKAYAKLVEAVKGREQSPLLVAAVDALVHLQTHPD